MTGSDRSAVLARAGDPRALGQAARVGGHEAADAVPWGDHVCAEADSGAVFLLVSMCGGLLAPGRGRGRPCRGSQGTRRAIPRHDVP